MDVPRATTELSRLDGLELSEIDAVRRDFLKGHLQLHTAEHDAGVLLLKNCLESQSLPAADHSYCTGLLADNLSDCVAGLQAAVEGNPFHQLARSRLAVTLPLLGDVDEAKNQASLGNKLNSKDPQFLLVMAMIHAMRGEVLLKDQRLAEAMNELPAEARNDAAARVNTLADVSQDFESTYGVSGDGWEAAQSPKQLIQAFSSRSISLALLFPDRSTHPWQFSMPAGSWTETLSKAIRVDPIAIAQMFLRPTPFVRERTEPLVEVISKNQLLLYLAGVVVFADGSTAEESIKAQELLRRAARADVMFPKLREYALDMAAAVAIDAQGPTGDMMMSQSEVMELVLNGGLTRPNNPGGPAFFWSILMRVGLYQPAEKFAQTALVGAEPDMKAFWEERLERTAWMKARLERIGQQAVRLTVEELAAELSKLDEAAKWNNANPEWCCTKSPFFARTLYAPSVSAADRSVAATCPYCGNTPLRFLTLNLLASKRDPIARLEIEKNCESPVHFRNHS